MDKETLPEQRARAIVAGSNAQPRQHRPARRKGSNGSCGLCARNSGACWSWWSRAPASQGFIPSIRRRRHLLDGIVARAHDRNCGKSSSGEEFSSDLLKSAAATRQI
jgi:hypothetical protein